eukprot:m.258009 g.258009  ORF g.258009 m.258009 type:complete len:53 (-) comp26611_c2_seq2:897-1055(-)
MLRCCRCQGRQFYRLKIFLFGGAARFGGSLSAADSTDTIVAAGGLLLAGGSE